jgi:hypothetical protein
MGALADLVREAIKAYDCDPNVFENEDFRERAEHALSQVPSEQVPMRPEIP